MIRRPAMGKKTFWLWLESFNGIEGRRIIAALQDAMKIQIFNKQRDVPIKAAFIKPIVKEVLENEDFATDEISIYFVSTKEICRLHQDFFDDPSPTDCISFPIDDKEEQASGYHILGEVFVCPKAATAISDHPLYKEITLYLVHGLLHLLGYDDIEEKDRKQMRTAEKKHMAQLENKKLLLKAP